MKLTEIIRSLGGIEKIDGTIDDNASDGELTSFLASSLVLAQGRQPVTVEEVRAQQTWLASEPTRLQKEAVKEQIRGMEASELLPRATREFMLVFMEMNLTPAQLAGNMGYVKMKAFDDQIKALRAQL